MNMSMKKGKPLPFPLTISPASLIPLSFGPDAAWNPEETLK